MAETKTYELRCPDPYCEAEFKLEIDPEALADGGELITCPECKGEWEWQLLDDGTLELSDEAELDDDEEDELDDEDEEQGLG